MSDQSEPSPDTPPDTRPGTPRATPPETEWQRKRRLAAVFGDVLPETTSDEREPGAGAPGDVDASEEWLKAQVPPHHGG